MKLAAIGLCLIMASCTTATPNRQCVTVTENDVKVISDHLARQIVVINKQSGC